jgi:HlyD family secretion protein
MDAPHSTSAAQARQTREQFVSPDEYLSYELGKAVRELPPLYTRLLAGTLSAIVFGAITWSYFSRVDEVAVTDGEIIPTSQIRPVKALEGGVLREVKVSEGDLVKKGDVLILQDPALNQAEVDRLSKNLKLVQQDIARLEAEQAGRSTSGSPLQDQLIAARLAEFDTKQAAAIADAQRQQAAIAESRAQLVRFQENLNNARKTLVNAQERTAGFERALEEGAIPRVDYLQARDQLTQAQDTVSSLQQQIIAQEQAIRQAEQAYASAQQVTNRVGAERRSEVLTQLSQRRETLADLEGQLKQSNIRAAGQVVTAPISGKIYNIEVNLAERTIEPGEELLSILPDGQELVVETKVLNRDIGFIQQGMKAKVKIATFPFQEFGTIDGEVVSLSPNATVDQQLGLVFKARVKLSRNYVMFNQQKIDLTPGMAATAEVVTRQRSVLTFLLEPITKRFSEAFTTR